jgi:hypothetical protein
LLNESDTLDNGQSAIWNRDAADGNDATARVKDLDCERAEASDGSRSSGETRTLGPAVFRVQHVDPVLTLPSGRILLGLPVLPD